MRKIILIGLVLIFGLCLMNAPVSADIYHPEYGCGGSILIPPWEGDTPPLCSFTPSATAECGLNGPIVHLTWPADPTGLGNYFIWTAHPFDVDIFHHQWGLIDIGGAPAIAADWTSIDFEVCPWNHGPFDMIIKHWNSDESRCLAVTTIDLPVCPSSSLVPISATNTVDQTHVLTATFVFGNGQILSDQTVTFSITDGPNAGMTGTAVTDAQGIATWSYSSSSPGTDTIIANWDDQIEQMHLQTNEAHKTWVAGNNIPEFPSTLLPATMIIGFLGTVLLIQRTREN
jgi:hypothetical protein